ncbi:isochorismate synthase [Leptolyngbya boryana NIES-2135]|jgi:menaquinone-specific isochorismate synthase|uniref:isochorismate synthase n=1 Tax=Leptolyngbya boryana NIES-2135 TaxID=1973484 RepID=A0A1Z4JBR1_LEPBY|nr:MULTISPECIES: isochorismate synthase [Leptolyngbya]BAY54214.1 isochorismate synthase [Leptolyngbya boryana NIES-2135]MBD2370277.1 isochorismate synthase [Leptolyngbya sp. FACHB-161]MBD2376619.1 isochorismate synthase [Leptolyngbya sp. FACHB-238]MBD2400891.1 isochorismate synthase [Leptolyngbya sp. FACHB-239]MBD2407539.1 isochorismate synthase [Leptolyngbya sp. FACHB-402]
MPAIQYQLHPKPDSKDLYQFLLRCKQSTHQGVASISINVEEIDLLAVLNSFVKPDQKHFYFENHGAVLAFDTALQFEAEGSDRFSQIKSFIETTRKKSYQIGDLDSEFSGIHFFCNFSFFDQTSDRLFPAASVFVPAWQISRNKGRSTIVANLEISESFDPATATDEVLSTIQRIRNVKVIRLALDIPKPFFNQNPVSDRFQKSVTAALKLIQSKHFQKIVLADALDITSPLPFNLVSSLSNLRSRYPNCYVFSASNGKGATFIGATPERLVKIENDRLFTVALAGSVPRGKTRAEDARLSATLLSRQKEKHEHQVVIDSIAQHLRNLGLTPQFSPPSLLQLPNIQHLQTPIRATIPSDLHLLDAVAELHPTPAVAGAPKLIACEHLKSFEPFERSWYAAPIGWMDHHGNGEFAVGIRSCILQGNQARLFAGAGIVAGSDPEKEFAEVQLKLQALLNALT